MDVKLVMFKANGQRKDFPIINPRTVIGRAENCDLQVPLLSVSRRQCELIVSEEDVKVKDLGSSNGTYVNNRRVNEVEVQAGDRLVIGPIVFTLQIGGRPEEIQPIKTRGQIMAEQGQVEFEEVVDLEADVLATPGASVLEEGDTQVAEAIPGDVDPIAALEALTAEDEPESPEEEEQKQEQSGLEETSHEC